MPILKFQKSSVKTLFTKKDSMTDYVIDKDPRLLDLKESYESGHKVIEFRVFNVL